MVTSSMLTDLIEAGSASTLTIEPDKNYKWSPSGSTITLSASSVNSSSDYKYHSSNVLLTLPQDCNFAASGVTLVDEPIKGEANRLKIEWWGSNVRLYLNGIREADSGGGESGGGDIEAGEYVYSVMASNKYTHYNNSTYYTTSSFIIYEACGGYWDSGFVTNNKPIYTNGKYSLVCSAVSQIYNAYCLVSGTPTADNFIQSIDTANTVDYKMPGYTGYNVVSGDYYNGSQVVAYGDSAIPSCQMFKSSISYAFTEGDNVSTANPLSGTSSDKTFYVTRNGTAVATSNNLPTGITLNGLNLQGTANAAGVYASTVALSSYNKYGGSKGTQNLTVNFNIIAEVTANWPDNLYVKDSVQTQGSAQSNNYEGTYVKQTSSKKNGCPYWYLSGTNPKYIYASSTSTGQKFWRLNTSLPTSSIFTESNYQVSYGYVPSYETMPNQVSAYYIFNTYTYSGSTYNNVSGSNFIVSGLPFPVIIGFTASGGTSSFQYMNGDWIDTETTNDSCPIYKFTGSNGTVYYIKRLTASDGNHYWVICTQTQNSSLTDGTSLYNITGGYYSMAYIQSTATTPIGLTFTVTSYYSGTPPTLSGEGGSGGGDEPVVIENPAYAYYVEGMHSSNGNYSDYGLTNNNYPMFIYPDVDGTSTSACIYHYVGSNDSKAWIINPSAPSTTSTPYDYSRSVGANDNPASPSGYDYQNNSGMYSNTPKVHPYMLSSYGFTANGINGQWYDTGTIRDGQPVYAINVSSYLLWYSATSECYGIGPSADYAGGTRWVTGPNSSSPAGSFTGHPTYGTGTIIWYGYEYDLQNEGSDEHTYLYTASGFVGSFADYNGDYWDTGEQIRRISHI